MHCFPSSPPSSPFSSLNPAQEKAVRTISGPLLLVAGAGSGKTRVITLRIAHLIEEGIDPDRILAVTFTNKAADEMRHRISSLVGANVLVRTFHSLGALLLRESIVALGYPKEFSILDEEDSLRLLKEEMQKLSLPAEKSDIKGARARISEAKNNLIIPSPTATLAEDLLYYNYQRALKNHGACDFDDLLLLPTILLQQFPAIKQHYEQRWNYLLVDEYQDTNHAQYTLTKLLLNEEQNLFVVGDPDQLIYSWRGADISNILDFEKDFPQAQRILLTQNYRSTNRILEAASDLIAKNEARFAKRLWSELGEGTSPKLYRALSEREEASFVASTIKKKRDRGDDLDGIAILYRTNAQSRLFEDYLGFSRLPYRMIGGISFYQRREIKEMVSYLKLIENGQDLLSFERAISFPKRGIGPKSIEGIKHYCLDQACSIRDFLKKLQDPRFKEVALPPKQRKALVDFSFLLERWRGERETLSLQKLILSIAQHSSILVTLREQKEEERVENIQELIAKAGEWGDEPATNHLSPFLEELALRQSSDDLASDGSISLMTVHNAKGLEFATVFLPGLEEDLFPHINAKDDPQKMEEERRLCYVAMTRAKRELYISLCRNRSLWGQERRMTPSRFVREIHSHLDMVG